MSQMSSSEKPCARSTSKSASTSSAERKATLSANSSIAFCRSVLDDAVEAIVGAGSGDDDHLAFCLRKPRIPEHECVVIGKERAKLVGPVGEREKHVGNEARFFLHFQHARADVLGQVRELRDRIAADCTRVHGGQDFG